MNDTQLQASQPQASASRPLRAAQPSPTLSGRRVLLGVTGSIAAYKACILVRLLVRAGAEVTVAMTEAACRFVTPLTFRTLSRRPVALDAFAEPESWSPEHVSLADWCDVLVVAPCTADAAAKFASGLAGDLLSSTFLACRKPKLLAPAMNDGMWDNPATQDNFATLRRRGVCIVEPDTGDLACGTSGRGRMPEPEIVLAAATALLAK